MIDRVVAKYGLHEQPSDVAYWLSKSPEERIAAVEFLRRQVIGESNVAGSKIQRVCSIITRERGALPDS
jgi:hypothetical protein